MAIRNSTQAANATQRKAKKQSNAQPPVLLTEAMFVKGKKPTERQFAELGRRAHKFFTAPRKPESEATKVSSEFMDHCCRADELLMKTHAVADLLWSDRDSGSEHEGNVGWLLCDLVREARKELELAQELHYKLKAVATALEAHHG